MAGVRRQWRRMGSCHTRNGICGSLRAADLASECAPMKNNAGLDPGMTFVLFICGDAALIRRCGRRSSARFGVAVVYDDEEKASLYSNECRPTLHFWLFFSGRQSLGYPVVVSVVVLLTSPWKLFYQLRPVSP